MEREKNYFTWRYEYYKQSGEVCRWIPFSYIEVLPKRSILMNMFSSNRCLDFNFYVIACLANLLKIRIECRSYMALFVAEMLVIFYEG